jgi:hypothetical protein
LRPVGSRVMAVRSASESTIELFGYGVYRGYAVPWDDEPEYLNPQILLESGEYVWGMECWWGSEEGFKEKYPNAEIVQVELTSGLNLKRKD